MSAGWTVGSIAVAGAAARATGRWMLAGPIVMAAALLGLAVLMPRAGLVEGQMMLIGLCLLAQGLGIGLSWPHVVAGVFRFASDSEKDLAAASMTIVVMVSNALGSASAGMVANVAGLAGGGVEGAAAAASVLFGSFIVAPALAFAAIRRILVLRNGA